MIVFLGLTKEIGITETEYTLMTGITYTLINAIFGLIMGYIADKYNRKWCLFGFGLTWTIMNLV